MHEIQNIIASLMKPLFTASRSPANVQINGKVRGREKHKANPRLRERYSANWMARAKIRSIQLF